MKYQDLTEDQKIYFKLYCDTKFGETKSFSESGEPLYFDEEGLLIDTTIVIELFFNINEN